MVRLKGHTSFGFYIYTPFNEGLTLKGVKMGYVPKVWVLMETVDPYDLQWGVTTESRIIGVFSTIENARDEFEIRKKKLTHVVDEDTDYVYGNSELTHILLEIKEYILDYVEI